MSSVSGLLVPNNFNVNSSSSLKGELKKVDFQLTPAQIISGTAVPILSTSPGILAGIDSVVCRLSGGTAYAGAGVIRVVSPQTSLDICSNANLLNTIASVSYINNNSPASSIEGTDSCVVELTISAALTTGDKVLSGTMYYYEYPVVPPV